VSATAAVTLRIRLDRKTDVQQDASTDNNLWWEKKTEKLIDEKHVSRMNMVEHRTFDNIFLDVEKQKQESTI